MTAAIQIIEILHASIWEKKKKGSPNIYAE